MARIVALMLISLPVVLSAQNEWALQSWMEVEGTYNEQHLGRSVGFAGKIGDSTKITVSDVNGVRVVHVRTPNDTTPRYFLTGDNTSLGDFNGDGIKDLVVSGNPTKIYLGTSPGFFDTMPSFVKHQELDGYLFGQHTEIGKINDDNFDDLLITDEGYPNGDLNGRVYLFRGGAQMDTTPNWIATGESKSSGLGWNVSAGDLNNDGFDEIIVRGYDQTGIGPSGTVRFAYVSIFRDNDTSAWKYIKGKDRVANGLSSFDVNGDGIDDLLWANADSLPTIFVHFGGFDIDSIPNLKLNDPGAGIGERIVNGGDLNGDGYNDIVTGVPGKSQDLGGVLVYSGGPQIDANFDAAAGLSVQSRFGESISPVGDINADGLDDIIVGAPRFQWDEYRGKWFILLGDTNILVTSVEEVAEAQPRSFSLLQNYPNPFNPSTTISYVLTVRAKVTLRVYNAIGQVIETLINTIQDSGGHSVNFNAEGRPSGVYFYELVTEKDGVIHTETKRMTLIK